MASSVAHRRLIRATYKGLLRAAEKLDAAPVAVAAEPFAARVAPFLPAGAAPVPASASTFTAVVRAQFRAGAAAPSPSAAPKSALVDAALRAMSLANQRLAAAAAAASASASSSAAVVAAPAVAAAAAVVAAPAKPSSVLYSVGQVFTHRASGYRGVIIGWDTSCKAGDKWVAATRTDALPHGTSQPFYHVLVDVRDRPDARISYVAQDNVELLPTPRAVAERERAAATAGGAGDASAAAAEGIVIHPLLTRYFTNIRLNAAATAASAFTGAGAEAVAEEGEEEGALAALPVYYQPTSKLAAAYPRDTPHAVALAPLLRLRAATAAAGAAAAAARAAAAAAAQANAALQHVWLGGSVSGGAEGEMRAGTGSSVAGTSEESDDDDDGSDDDDDVKHNSNGRAARLK